MKFTLAFSILVLLVITGCGTTKILEYKSPVVEVGEIEIESVDFDGILLSANVQMTNDQAFESTITKHEYNVIVADYPVVSGSFENGMNLIPNQTSQSNQSIYIPYSGLLSHFGSFGDLETIPVIIQSSLTSIQTGSESAEPLIQIDSINTQIPVLQLPRIVVDTLELKSFNLAVAELELALRVVNPNPFPVIVNSLDFEIMVDGTRWNNQQINQRFEVPVRSDILINTPFSMRPRDFSTEVYRMLNMSQAFEFNVIGSVYYDIELPNFRGGDATPFQISQFQKFDRLGN